jgi:hypothetical protein
MVHNVHNVVYIIVVSITLVDTQCNNAGPLVYVGFRVLYVCHNFAVPGSDTTVDFATDNPAEGDEPDDFKWTRSLVLMLIDNCLSKKDDFSNPQKKKKRVWESVALVMKAHGYNVTWAVCEKKMRNMKQTYKSIKDSNGKTGRGRKSWEYYDGMEAIFGKDPTVALPNIVESSKGAVGPGCKAGDRVSAHTGGCSDPETNSQESEGESEISITQEDFESSTSGGRKKRRVSKQGTKFESMAKVLQESKEVEEKKLWAIKQMTESMEKCNTERVKAVSELNETLKQLVNKL